MYKRQLLDGILRRADDRLNSLEQAVGIELFHRALELADVVFEMVCNELGHIVGQIESQQIGLAADDRHPDVYKRQECPLSG